MAFGLPADAIMEAMDEPGGPFFLGGGLEVDLQFSFSF